MSKTVTVEKAKAKAPAKSAAKAKAKAPLAAVATALSAKSEADAKREAERAKRYPQAAAQEAAKKTAKAAGTPKEKKEKPVAVAFTPRTAKAGQTLHLLDERSRPSRLARSRLFAHTHAVLVVTGMLDAARPAVPQSQVLQMMGQRAVTYHRQKLNFEDAPNHGIRLSVAGRNHFAARMAEGKIDNNAANAFVAMMLDGKIDHAATGIAQQNVYQVKF